ncbi:unnamed protein product [Cyprideis torosa]|uniref:lysoplasmalogenase n=1 Tax=Cyprideis torosa TaxID=163714 RepID=A0A7R8WMA0_9CRUS|nr:unnamed protein product [Cyprideis torosa]CAG0905119.1 unnamed protein product [Cyprideis torosa]
MNNADWLQFYLVTHDKLRDILSPSDPITCPAQLWKIGPKLVPFCMATAIYYAVFIPNDEPSTFAMVLKCLPVLSLIFFVLSHGISFGQEHAYSRRVLFGLTFSMFGDAFLIYKEAFVHGVAAFAIAHILYISAFGFSPLKPAIGGILGGVAFVGYYFAAPFRNGPLVYIIPMYIILLTVMCWRAIARVQFFEELWTWTKLCSSVGGIVFVISDTVLGVNRFLVPVPYHQAIIMTTYYFAQLMISLSVVDSAKLSALEKERECTAPHKETDKAVEGKVGAEVTDAKKQV